MTFSSVVPETLSDSHSTTSNSERNSDVSTPFYLSQSELFPDHIASLNHVVKDLEEHISDLDLHKSRIDDTYERYTIYVKESEEQRLSRQILNAHFRHFQKALASFLQYIKYEQITSPMKTDSFDLDNTRDVTEPRISACQQLLQYDFGGSNADSKANVDKLATSICMDELVSLVRTACDVSKNLTKRYWDEEVRISLAGPGTPPAL
jgi:hypothetical protein